MKLASRLTAPVLLLAVLGLGLSGIHRSLWLDETWVANSVLAPTLRGMFDYPGWLQTTPPLFLLLVRAMVHLAGPSNAAFRIVPLLFSVAAAGLMLAASRRVLTPPFAGLATALVIFNGTAIEYSHTLKSYSAELASAAALLLLTLRYLERPNSRRFVWLLAAVVVALPLAYSPAFFLPGIVLAVLSTGKRRALLMALFAALMLLSLYWLSIRPNLAPELHEFWANNAGREVGAGLLAALLLCVIAGIRAVLALAQGDVSPRNWAYLLCALPCVLLAAGGALGWYPVSNRTRLFVLPCLVLVAMMLLEELMQRLALREVSAIAAVALTFAVAGYAIVGRIVGPGDTFEEDFDGAVSFLARHAAPSDLILVHACCKEGFLLYSGLDHWSPPHLLFGDTGWPCCARGKDASPGSSSTSAVIADLDSKIPHGYSGRVWLLYITRPTHWDYTGLDEGNLWRKHLWDRGCPPGPYIRFANLAVSPMNCAAAR